MTYPYTREEISASVRAAAEALGLAPEFFPPLEPVQAVATDGDAHLRAMHQQSEPWTREQWAYAEMMEARHA